MYNDPIVEQTRKLRDEYEFLRWQLRGFLPRRERNTPIPKDLFKLIVSQFPELHWSRPGDSLNVTTSDAAKLVLASRYSVRPGRVRKALGQARRES